MAEVERDHYPEIVENGQGMHRLELMGLDERLANPSDRRALFADMTPDDFNRMYGYVNSITRGEAVVYEHEDGQLPGTATPTLEDKGPLMEATVKAVNDIAASSELDDRTALRRIGLTMAGAIDFIHPKKNGNGRSGRIMHYAAEFGTERGAKAVNEELYAIIGKLPVYDTDSRVALYDTPPSELEEMLDVYCKNNDAEYVTRDPRERASVRVVAFLDMMRGVAEVPLVQPVVAGGGMTKQNGKIVNIVRMIQPGEMDGVGLYEQHYTSMSELPNRDAEDVPEGAHRVMGDKKTAIGQLVINADLV